MSMRLHVHADVENKPMMHFPWDYHLSLTSFIYEALGDTRPHLASKLHQAGHAPPFSFSDFLQTGSYEVTRNGLFFTSGYFSISSTDAGIIDAITDYVPSDGSLKIGNTEVPVVGQTVEQSVGYDGETQYKSRSAVAVGEYPHDSSSGNPREWYLPSDPMWASRIKDSVRANMKQERGLPDEFRFRILDYEEVDKKVKRVTDDIEIPCVMVSMTIDADEKTSRFVQDFGIGERTGMGFGNIVRDDMVKQRYR